MSVWLIEFLDFWMPFAALSVGVTLVGLGAFFHKPLKYAGIVVVLVGTWLLGAVYVSEYWKQAVEKAREQAEEIKALSQAVNDNLSAEVARLEKLTKEKQRVRTEYITNVVTQYDDRCDVSNAAVSVLHSAAENGVPPSPSSTDGDTPDVKISDIVQNTSDNYATCYQFRDQVIGWQRWYTEQKQLYERQ